VTSPTAPAVGVGIGWVTLPIYIAIPAFSGAGALSTTIVLNPGTAPVFAGQGVLSASALAQLAAFPQFSGSGQLGGYPDGLSAVAGIPNDGLMATIVPILAAAFSGAGLLLNAPSVTASLSGTGALSAAAFLGGAASPAFTGGGSLTATAMVAYSETNTVRTNQPVPTGCSGCYVTLIGGGGAGGQGQPASNGAGGGGGGGRVNRTFVPVASLGATYSTGVGVGGGSAGVAGSASTFSSGGVSLSAGGGGGGVGGGGTAGGGGGACSATGVTASTA
jgi:hypothetical protein